MPLFKKYPVILIKNYNAKIKAKYGIKAFYRDLIL